jgi:hypothetical protein
MDIFAWFKSKPKSKKKYQTFTYHIHKHVIEYADGKEPITKYALQIVAPYIPERESYAWKQDADGKLHFGYSFYAPFSLEEIEMMIEKYKKYLHSQPISSEYTIVRSGIDIIA